MRFSQTQVASRAFPHPQACASDLRRSIRKKFGIKILLKIAFRLVREMPERWRSPQKRSHYCIPKGRRWSKIADLIRQKSIFHSTPLSVSLSKCSTFSNAQFRPSILPESSNRGTTFCETRRADCQPWHARDREASLPPAVGPAAALCDAASCGCRRRGRRRPGVGARYAARAWAGVGLRTGGGTHRRPRAGGRRPARNLPFPRLPSGGSARGARDSAARTSVARPFGRPPCVYGVGAGFFTVCGMLPRCSRVAAG